MRNTGEDVKRPNLLYLHSHDTGRWIEPHGAAVPTPNLAALAREGVMFRKAFCAAPTCSPSRAAMLTGQSPHSCGLLGLTHRGFAMAHPGHHLARFLKGHGYRTALSGIQHEIAAGREKDLGYDEVLAPAREGLEGACAFLEAAEVPQPFFLAVGFHETHRVFPEPGPGEDPSSCAPAPHVPDEPGTRRDMAAFKASARELDRKVGKVLELLRRRGLDRDTIVLCTTDHGPAFPLMKCNLTDDGLGVYLLLRGPQGLSGGKVVDAMVSHLDVFPTLCELAGLPAPSWLEGTSLMPLVRGEKAEVREELFGEVTYHAAYQPMRAARTARHKLILRFGGRARPVLPNCDDGPSKDALLRAGWKEASLPEEELYDLALDPREGRNLAADPAHAGTLRAMRARLRGWMERTNDPLLKGPVPAPAGAVVSDPDWTRVKGP
jgi:arylsulfatase A-like enzyme